ncbi:hypothetical protein [Adhaeribacter aquaticus]|uniref:hypothetical protein n=1 Tax=Adhaeribacter aquaticus TaxID=299567 RepID=UPI00040B9B31|nr:hypothetical protein [Adhaeribacter aquaticus]
MVRYKLYGILSLFIFSFPKLFSNTLNPRENPTSTSQETILHKEVPVSLKSEEKESFHVSASVYFPEEEQTDSTPYITADGSKINEERPGQHRWVAVSRNLLRKWGGSIDYGDTLHVKGISDKLDGVYVVRDTMTRRIKNRIDILVGEDDEIMGFWDNVQIYNLN